jgi:hypothetical protein
MPVKRYLLSFPERMVRAVVGLGAGVAREVGVVALPASVRRSQLYQNMVETTLRFLTEQVGGTEPAEGTGDALPEDFLVRRTAGNVVEILGIVAFRASPVWVLAALADVSGIGRKLIPEIADALKTQGLLDPDAQFMSMDEMLDGLEKTSSRLATTINTPPLDVKSLRQEWEGIRRDARSLQPASLPSAETVGALWDRLKEESKRQNTTIFQTSSTMAIDAVRAVPEGVRWLSASARVGAVRTGHVFAAALLDHYKVTLNDIQRVGYLTYTGTQLRPYVHAAARQFSPTHRTLTERLLDKFDASRKRHAQ